MVLLQFKISDIATDCNHNLVGRIRHSPLTIFIMAAGRIRRIAADLVHRIVVGRIHRIVVGRIHRIVVGRIRILLAILAIFVVACGGYFASLLCIVPLRIVPEKPNILEFPNAAHEFDNSNNKRYHCSRRTCP